MPSSVSSPTAYKLKLTSPIGTLLAEHDGERVTGLHLPKPGTHQTHPFAAEPSRDDALGWALSEQLRDYFRGRRKEFDLPLSLAGTAFQQRVWAALSEIPYGETRSYSDIAAMVGIPKAPRAVGQANSRNPVPIIVPCHRVLASGNRLGGYMGSGPDGPGAELKRWFLRHEGVAGW
jgi:methylated-DNA-[protein]-cysteine S-methyltransferase